MSKIGRVSTGISINLRSTMHRAITLEGINSTRQIVWRVGQSLCIKQVRDFFLCQEETRYHRIKYAHKSITIVISV